VIRIHDYRFIRRALASGDIGFAEGYMAGEWDTPDLSVVLEAFSLNFDRLTALVRGNPLMQAVNKPLSPVPSQRSARARGRTSTPTTTWATASIRAGWTPA
jgi:hypothetical protein